LDRERVKRNNKKPVAYKINKNHIEYALGEIKKNKTITMNNLLSKIKNKYPSFNLSTRHLEQRRF